MPKTKTLAQQYISIHALVKRATQAPEKLPCVAVYFNPRPRKEGDLALKDTSKKYVYFNPRPRKEGDTTTFLLTTHGRHFNPRPRKEGD